MNLIFSKKTHYKFYFKHFLELNPFSHLGGYLWEVQRITLMQRVLHTVGCNHAEEKKYLCICAASENNCFHMTADVIFMILIFNMKDLLMEA